MICLLFSSIYDDSYLDSFIYLTYYSIISFMFSFILTSFNCSGSNVLMYVIVAFWLKAPL